MGMRMGVRKRGGMYLITCKPFIIPCMECHSLRLAYPMNNEKVLKHVTTNKNQKKNKITNDNKNNNNNTNATQDDNNNNNPIAMTHNTKDGDNKK